MKSLFLVLVMVSICVLAEYLHLGLKSYGINKWKYIGAVRTSTCLSHNKINVCVCVLVSVCVCVCVYISVGQIYITCF